MDTEQWRSVVKESPHGRPLPHVKGFVRGLQCRGSSVDQEHAS